MIVKLIRDARIKHRSGEVVKVSSEEGAFLLSVGSAVIVAAKPAVETAVKKEPAETRRKRTSK